MGYSEWSNATKSRMSLQSFYLFCPYSILYHQPGHDNWIRALAFHPSGKYLLSASDDKTVRVWELSTGRCMKTVDAHNHFVTTLAWGRQSTSGTAVNGTNGDVASEPEKLVNVIATGSVDQTVKIWLPWLVAGLVGLWHCRIFVSADQLTLAVIIVAYGSNYTHY